MLRAGGRRMKRVKRLVFRSLIFVAIATPCAVTAQTQKAPPPVAPLGETAESGVGHFIESPQDSVVCTGWHALCSASYDCRMNGDKADCDCLRVNEAHIVLTAEIQDPAVKRLTQAKCTVRHP